MVLQESNFLFVLLGIYFPPLSLPLFNGFTFQLPLSDLLPQHELTHRGLCMSMQQKSSQMLTRHDEDRQSGWQSMQTKMVSGVLPRCRCKQLEDDTCFSKSFVSASKVPMRPSMSPLPCSVCNAFRIPNAMLLSYSVCRQACHCACTPLWGVAMRTRLSKQSRCCCKKLALDRCCKFA